MLCCATLLRLPDIISFPPDPRINLSYRRGRWHLRRGVFNFSAPRADDRFAA